MLNATRRLLAVQEALAPAVSDKTQTTSPISPAQSTSISLSFLLPDNARVGVQHPDEGTLERTSVVTLNGTTIGEFGRTRGNTLLARLTPTALGTPFEGRAHHVPEYPVLEIAPPCSSDGFAVSDLWAVIYALFVLYHEQEHIPIVFSERIRDIGVLSDYILSSGLGQTQTQTDEGSASTPFDSRKILFLSRMAFWQGAGTVGFHRRGWLAPINAGSIASASSTAPPSTIPFPYTPSFTRNDLVIAAHPLRPPKPQPGELLYRRYCPSVGMMLEFHHFCLEDTGPSPLRHLEAFHRWHNNPRVNAGWGESGTLEYHREYIQKILSNPAVLPVMMSWNGELMGYLEFVWVKEDHLAPYIGNGEGGTQARDWDRSLHILVGEDHFTGKKFCASPFSLVLPLLLLRPPLFSAAAWLSSCMHYLFLADPRTDRVVAEPKATNAGAVQAVLNAGMHAQTIFDFPYKRSMLMLLPRERFFKLDLL
ncbi:hypothetical protein HGRIS_005624 [Hohenbuehelia grisea]|uniref:Acyltransferase MbtK/IucB-like conserved domain-containing protein n=1 Tax=Hohenbuehelia grisea TaxID=104357 RepID=A0ABR3JXD6_9AGAR